jgi:hypothetical protein
MGNETDLVEANKDEMDRLEQVAEGLVLREHLPSGRWWEREPEQLR